MRNGGFGLLFCVWAPIGRADSVTAALKVLEVLQLLNIDKYTCRY